MEFEGRILIVTGAAGGIGLATARELAGLGARLVVTDVDGPRLERELDELAAACEAGDLTDPAVRARVVERALGLGGLDGLVCCHGIAGMAPILDFPLELWQRQHDVNSTSIFFLCQAAAPHIRPGESLGKELGEDLDQFVFGVGGGEVVHIDPRRGVPNLES